MLKFANIFQFLFRFSSLHYSKYEYFYNTCPRVQDNNFVPNYFLLVEKKL